MIDNDDLNQNLLNNSILNPIEQSKADHQRIIKKIEKKKNKIYLSIFCINAKDIFLMLLLLIGPMGNFSILNLPYTLFGLSFFWLILNNSIRSRRFKTIYEVILAAYSSLLIITKTIIFTQKDSLSNSEYKSLLINLGFQFLKNDDTMNGLIINIMLFLSDSLVLTGSMISIIINWTTYPYMIEKEEEEEDQFKYYNTAKQIRSHWPNILVIILIANCVLLISFNISYMTMCLSILEQITVILWAFNYKDRLILFSRTLYIIIALVTALIILSTHLSNLPDIIDMINKIEENKQYFYHFGIVMIYSNEIKSTYINMIYFFFVCTGFTIASFSFRYVKTIRYSKEDDSANGYSIKGGNKAIEDQSNKDDNENENNSKEKTEKQIKKPTFFELIKSLIITYIKSPYFVMHFCRIGVLFWITLYLNYYSIGLLIWLCLSYIFTKESIVLLYTVFLGLPCLLITFHISFVYNMPNNMPIDLDQNTKFKFKLCGIQKYSIDFLEIFFQQITQLIFLYLINVLIQIAGNPIKKVKQKEKEEKEIEDTFPLKKARIRYTLIFNKNRSKSFKANIVKLILYNIDKISLLCMYLVAISSINCSHFILVICFIIQLIFTNVINKFGYVFIVLIQIIFALEYFMHIFKLSINEGKPLEIIQFLIPFDSQIENVSIEPILFLAVYCFYIQFYSCRSEMHREVQNVNWTEYINYKLEHFPNIKKGVFFVIDFIIEIYLIILMGLSFWLIVYFEINILLDIKLILFSSNCYFIFTSIQSAKRLQNCISYCFLSYCCINTLLVYFYQFQGLAFSQNFIILIVKFIGNDDIIKNLPIIGLQVYEKSLLSMKFFPHFGMNLLSVLFFVENKRKVQEEKTETTISSKDTYQTQNKSTKRTFKQLDSTYDDNNDILMPDEDQLENLKESNIDHDDDVDIVNDDNEEDQAKEIEIKETLQINLLEESLIASQSTAKQQKPKEPQLNYYDLIIIKIIFMFYWSILHITKYYWLLLFIFVCIIITTVELSIFMILYFFIFALLFILMFRHRISVLSSFIKQPSFFFSKVIRYHLVEIPSSEKIMKFYKKIGFYSLLLVSIIFIIIAYTYTVIDIFQNGCEPPRCDSKVDIQPIMSQNVADYFNAISYLSGAAINRKKSFLVGIWPHFVFMILILLDIYIQKLENILEEKCLEQSNKQFELEKQLFKNNIIIPEDSSLYESNTSYNFDVSKSVLNDSVINKQMKIIRNIEGNRVEKLKKLFRSYDSSKEAVINKERKSTTRLKRILKKVAQELIILVLIFISILKLNIWSFIYMCVVVLLSVSKRTMKRFYLLMIFLVFTLLIQLILFTSNLSDETVHNPNRFMLILLKRKLFIPWYPSFFKDSWGHFWGLGVHHIQISHIWLEIAEILFLFIFLDFYSYGVYQESNFNNTINYSQIPNKSKLLRILKRTEEREYKKIKEVLRYNFEIRLDTLDKFKAIIEKHIKPKANIFKKKATKNYLKWNDVLRIYFYFSMTNITLIFILGTAVYASGLLSYLLLIFSLLFLLNSTDIIEGKKSNFPKANRTVFKVLVISDIFIQLIAQMPFNYKFNNTMKIIQSLIGIGHILDYKNPEQSRTFKYNESQMIFVNAKAIAFLLISLQVLLFSSRHFKEFYISHIFLKHHTFKKGAIVHSYFFNNKRIEEMNDSNKIKMDMQRNLESIEKTVNNLNTKMNQQRNSGLSNMEKLKLFCYNQDINNDSARLSQREANKNEIKDYLKKGILTWIYSWFHNHSIFYYLIDKSLKKEYKEYVSKGKTVIDTKIDKEIDLFLHDIDLSLMNQKDMTKIKDILDNKNKGEKEDRKSKKKKKKQQIKDIQRKDDDNKKALEERNRKADKDECSDILFDKEESKLNEAKEEEIDKEKNKKEQLYKKREIKKIKSIFSSPLYKKYLTNTYLIKNICVSIALILFNSKYVVFLLMIINNMINNSILSIVYPILAFCIGLLYYPRPTNKFWNICIGYSTLLILLKCGIRLFEFNEEVKYFFNFQDKYKYIFDILADYKIGLTLYQEYNLSFFGYIFSDPIVLFSIINLKQSLIYRGLWKKSEIEIESIPHAHQRIFKAISDLPTEFPTNHNKENSKVKRKGFFHSLFSKTRNEKPGIDLFFIYTTIMFIIVIYCLFCYSNMERDSIYALTDSNLQKQFSGYMVLLTLIHVLLIIFDRIIYIRHNRMNPTFEYLIFDKITGDQIVGFDENKLNFNKTMPRIQNPFSDQELDTLSSKFHIVVIQYEPINYPLIAKYALHLLTVLFSHLIIFFYFPMYGNYNLHNSLNCDKDDKECNDFAYNPYLIIFYILYATYLFISSIQIHYGFYDIRKKSLIKSSTSFFNAIILQSIDIIPFFSEIKLAIDWTFTSTSLGLFQWNKFERIYNIFFITLCTFKLYDKIKVGSESSILLKLLLGGTLIVFIVIVLVGPLFLFSTLNPINEYNNVTGAMTSLYISFKYETVNNKYKLFENEHANEILYMKNELWDQTNYSNSSQTKAFPKDQVQLIQMNGFSDSNWGLTRQTIEKINRTLLNREIIAKDNKLNQILFQLFYKFSRKHSADTDNNQSFDFELFNRNNKRDENRNDLIENFLEFIKCKNNKQNMTLNKFYTPAIRLTTDSKPLKIIDEEYINSIDIDLVFYCNKNSKTDDEGNIDYSKTYFSLMLNSTSEEGLKFHAFSDKIAKSLMSYNVLTFYIAWVLLLGNTLKRIFSDQEFTCILTEMPDADQLLNLCEGIKISRYTRQLEKEEELYYVLMEFMRSPDYLNYITKSSIEKFRERQAMKEHID